MEAHERAPREIVLDLDNTDIPLHGEQEGRFFHGYYKRGPATCRSTCSAAGTCCWPASGVRTLPAAMARSKRSRALSRGSAKNGRARIILRADSGFSNDGLMGWCEANRVDYVFGLAPIAAWRQHWSISLPRRSVYL